MILGGSYDANTVKQFEDFITRCRQHLKSHSNLFWVALQSNLLADTSDVENGFNEEFKQMKEDLPNKGWILPILETNMRNQINISNINVKSNTSYQMQASINKSKSGTSVVGGVPILLRRDPRGNPKGDPRVDWDKKKGAVLKHCIEEMNKKDKKNVVVLYDYHLFKEVGKDLKRSEKFDKR